MNFLNFKSTFRYFKRNLKSILITYGMCLLFRGFQKVFLFRYKKVRRGIEKEKYSILLFKYLGLLLIFEVACQLLSFNDHKEIKERERKCFELIWQLQLIMEFQMGLFLLVQARVSVDCEY